MAEEGASEVSGAPIRRVLLISAGASHSVALLSENVFCSWGRGEDGQLGHGDAEDRLLPTHLSALDGHEIVSVTCGADHTIAYSDSRTQAYSWGWGDFGRLGHGNSSDLFTPQPIKALYGLRIRQIACGDSHCLAVTMEVGGGIKMVNLVLAPQKTLLCHRRFKRFREYLSKWLLLVPNILQLSQKMDHSMDGVGADMETWA